MEISLLTKQDIEDDWIFSVRAGTIKRQAPVSSARPFRFPKMSMEEGPLKIALLKQVATGYLVLKPTDGNYRVQFESGPSCEVGVRKVTDGEEVKEKPPDETKEGAASATEAKEYLERHQVLQFVQALLQAVIKERPKDPYGYMARHFTNGYNADENWSPRKPATGEPAAPKDSSMARTMEPAEAAKAQAVKEPPLAAVTEPTKAAPALGAEGLELLRTKSRQALLEACQDGRLPVLLQTTGAQSPAVTDGEENVERVRQQARVGLLEAFHSGQLVPAMQEVLKDGGTSSPSVDTMRTHARDCLLQANASGALSGALGSLKRPGATEGRTDPEVLRLQVQKTLMQACEDGSLSQSLQAAIDDQSAGELRAKAVQALLKSQGDGTLAAALQRSLGA